MKIKNCFDIESYKKFSKNFTDSLGKAERHFADSGLILKQNLKEIDPTVFEKKFPDLAFVNSGIQTSNIGGYADIIESLRTVPFGEYRNTDDQANSGKGKIGLKGEANNIKVIGRTAESRWTDDDIKRAELQGFNIQNKLIAAHNQQFQREVDEFGLLGFNGKDGLLNSSAFTSTSATKTAAVGTAQENYDEASELINSQRNKVNNTPAYQANVVIMATDVMNKLQSQMMNTAGSTKSVLAALQDNYPQISFMASFRCNSSNFNSGGSRTVAYSTDEQAMQFRLPVPLTIGEIYQLGSFNFHVESKYRCAGLDVLDTNSAEILTGL